jgi:hypothetical protein
MARNKTEFKALCKWFNEINNDVEFARALRKYPGLMNYDANGGWVGNVSNENGWTS